MKKGKRFLALFLAFAMVVTSVNLSGWTTVKAETPTPVGTYSFEGELGTDVTLVCGKASSGAEAISSYAGDAVYGEGKSGQAVEFGGNNYGVQLPHTNLGDTYTFSAWVKPTGAIAANSVVLFFGNNDPAEKWLGLAGNDGSQTCKAWTREPAGNYNGWITTGTTALVANEWTYITFAQTGENLSVYKNGALVVSGNASAALSGETQLMLLGTNPWDASFSGYIDEVSVWDEELTADQIANEYLAVATEAEAKALLRNQIGTSILGENANAERILTDLVIPSTAVGFTSLTWESDAAGKINNAGKVLVKDGSTVNFTVTATYATGSFTDTYSFTLGEPVAPVGTYSFEGELGTGAAAVCGKIANGSQGIWDYAGTVNYGEGKSGQAVQFDSTNNYGVQLPHTNLGEAYTLSAWIKPTGTIANNSAVIFMGHDNPEKWFGISGSGGQNTKIWTREPNGNYNGWITVTTTDFPANEWTHITLAQAGESVAIYKNGVLLTTGSASAALNGENQKLVLGTGPWDNSFNGLIDEVSVWNAQLTKEEVAAEYLSYLTDEEKVEFIKNQIKTTVLNGNASFDKVTGDLELPDYCLGGFSLEWTSSNEAAVTSAGVFANTDDAAPQTTTLKFTTTYDETDLEGSWEVTAATQKAFDKAAFDAKTDDEKKAYIQSAIDTAFLNGNTAKDKIYADVDPITSITSGTAEVATVEWTSSAPEVMNTAGEIVTANKFAMDVTMTAKVKYNGSYVDDWGMTYVLIVEKPTTINVAVENETAVIGATKIDGTTHTKENPQTDGSYNLSTKFEPANHDAAGCETHAEYVVEGDAEGREATATGSNITAMGGNRVGAVKFSLADLSGVAANEIKSATVALHVVKTHSQFKSQKAKFAIYPVASDAAVDFTSATTFEPKNGYGYDATIYSKEWLDASTSNATLTFDVTDLIKEAITAEDANAIFRMQPVMVCAFVMATGENAPKLLINYKDPSLTPERMAQADLDAINVDEAGKVITDDFTLPVLGSKNNTTITWASDNTAVTVDGSNAIVTRPEADEENVTVTLTPTAHYVDEDETTKTLTGTPITVTVEKYADLDAITIADFDFDAAPVDGAFVGGGAKGTLVGTSYSITDDSKINNALKLNGNSGKTYIDITKEDGSAFLADDGVVRDEMTVSYYSKTADTANSWLLFAVENYNAINWYSGIRTKYLTIQDLASAVGVARNHTEGNSGDDKFISASGVSSNTWKKVDVVIKKNSTETYINGVLKATDTNIDNRSLSSIVGAEGGKLSLGMGTWGGGEYFGGTIDEFKIYNRALTADEIEHAYVLDQPAISATVIDKAIKTAMLGENAS